MDLNSVEKPEDLVQRPLHSLFPEVCLLVGTVVGLGKGVSGSSKCDFVFLKLHGKQKKNT